MNAVGVGDSVCKAVRQKNADRSSEYPLVICNFAPPDMVGHTGMFEPCVRACAATDVAIGEILKACAEEQYVCIITSDHGNAEMMLDASGNPKTSHSCNMVPLNVAPIPGQTLAFTSVAQTSGGGLCDVAPTCLALMGLPVPADMSGQVLVEQAKE
jgi:2,3-bisphosphoglycerate-independent phosphoglycerate mutase